MGNNISSFNPVVPVRVDWGSVAEPKKSATPSAGSTNGRSVAQAPGSSSEPPAKLSESELKKLNPDFKHADAAVGRGWYDFFVSSKHTEEISGTNGVKTTKPIPLGNGLTLPVGTTVSPIGGVTKLGPARGEGPSDGIEFQLPNGKKIRLEPDRDKETALINTRVTFDDGKFLRVPGTPFFNKQTGALGRVSPSGMPDTHTAQKYTLRDAFMPNAIGTWPARKGAISGSDFETAMRNALR